MINNLVNKQSQLDAMPCSLLKEISTSILPSLHRIINISLQTGSVPTVLKNSIVTPVIKSSNLDSDVLNNYRPVSNSPILHKVFEKCILNQLINHLDNNNLIANHQSAYRSHHSCETAITKVVDDVLIEMNNTSFVVMSFLDFSAAFDTVDHSTLIKRLEISYGISGTALEWFKSYLSYRTYKIKVNNTLSDPQSLSYGVPQGSILGPILYSLYVKDIEKIANQYGVGIHVYADDVVLYSNSNQIDNFKECHDKIKIWTSQNFLKLNDKKTQLMCISTKKLHHKNT